MNPKYFRVVRRIIIFGMICWLGNILWKNHTTPHYETPSGSQKAEDRSTLSGSPKVEDKSTQAKSFPAK